MSEVPDTSRLLANFLAVLEETFFTCSTRFSEFCKSSERTSVFSTLKNRSPSLQKTYNNETMKFYKGLIGNYNNSLKVKAEYTEG